MNGKITKVLILLALSLTATTGYGARKRAPYPPSSSQHPSNYDQRHGADPHQMMGARDTSAHHEMNDALNLFVCLDFIYWQPRQENMGLANTEPAQEAGVASTVIYQQFNWKPGFKIGLGMNFGYDDWSGLVEYTWFHNNHTTSSTAPNLDHGGKLAMNWLSGGLAERFSNKWNLQMDLLDLLLQRTSYMGTMLRSKILYGVRATWINQRMDFKIPPRPAMEKAEEAECEEECEVPILSHVDSSYYSGSWALGPRFEWDLSWMLNWGVSLVSKLAGDLSYTRYNVSWFENTITSEDLERSAYLTASHLRPHAEARFGFGWGSDFFWGSRIEFMATYDFNVWWGQNMMRALNSYVDLLQEIQGSLYTHGLDLKVKFDF